jgi:hypothetical protein
MRLQVALPSGPGGGQDFACRAYGSPLSLRSNNLKLAMTPIIQLPQTLALSFFGKHMLLAQVTTDYRTSAGGSPLGMIIPVIIAVLIIVAMWKIFTKAGQPGWASIIPIYNIYIWCKIVGRPGWWVLLMFIPLVNLIIAIILCIDLAKSFGKGAGFGIGIILLGFIFLLILAFSDAQYQGAAPATAATI